jgi:pilus assembly protein CpaF
MTGAADDVLARLAAEVHRSVARAEGDAAQAAEREVAARAPLLEGVARRLLVERVVARVHGLGALETLLADPAVTEVLVNGGRDVWVERAGRLTRAPVTLAVGEAEQLVERMLAPLGVRADRLSPVADARLPDGSRLHVVLPPVAADGPSLAIRRFRPGGVPLDAFGPPPLVGLLAGCVADRRNVLVSGATSAGKTTLSFNDLWH